MIRSTELAAFDSLSVRFLEATTPRYLYRHFRESPGPQQLARQYNSTQLVEEIDRLTVQMPLDMSQIVLAYACAMALTHRPLHEMNEALATGPLNYPPWFPYIMETYRATAISDSYRPRVMAAATPTLIQTTPLTAANTAVSPISTNPQPRILTSVASTAVNTVRNRETP